ncbi:Clathrin light chain [Purpureocillium takamizusanense]|uniref:Clathrin light chain n=1 Tax=Purpureocillium takamizusanense TaxID=2060973 RepID=A0A9Q8QTB6_9HYPO|nr:Clathrin light chain [Purpureocillium takamizusanense]UNI24451.1 Clathrin light chain [Purpureocillium takamizusanense]
MADRFPSLEDFDSGAQTDIKDPSAEPSADDFLAREKAVLGDDAQQFVTSDDVAALGEPGDDLLAQGDAAQSTFESQFPDLASPSAGTLGAPGATSITGPSVSYNSGYQARAEDEAEPEVIKEWRERRDAQIAKRAEQFAAQRQETIKEAQQNIDDFYENYNSKKEKGIAQTRKDAEQFLANQEDTVSGGTSWDRIAKLVDVSGKGTRGGAAGSGKERFREMLTSLRKDEKAPGATGY